ncbi:hypothetical protein SDC9_157503 [bioreactor metagenome]|uniref:Uncharacterized protein n=1 Tax=bioreactor metagenome TaxID=1076179 RepID=A0A645F760_9ZZZZ
MIHRTGNRAHAAGNGCALKGGARRGGAADAARSVGQREFTVCADVQ